MIEKIFCIARNSATRRSDARSAFRQDHVQQEDRVMLLRFGFDQCCEVVGRASAIIAIAGMASLVFAAIAVDVFR